VFYVKLYVHSLVDKLKWKKGYPLDSPSRGPSCVFRTIFYPDLCKWWQGFETPFQTGLEPQWSRFTFASSVQATTCPIFSEIWPWWSRPEIHSRTTEKYCHIFTFSITFLPLVTPPLISACARHEDQDNGRGNSFLLHPWVHLRQRF